MGALRPIFSLDFHFPLNTFSLNDATAARVGNIRIASFMPSKSLEDNVVRPFLSTLNRVNNNSQSSFVQYRSLNLDNKSRKRVCSTSSPACRITRVRVTEMVNDRYVVFPCNASASASPDNPANSQKRERSPTGPNWPQSPTNAIETPPKKSSDESGNAWRRCESIFANPLNPIIDFSSMIKYFTCFQRFCKRSKAEPCNGAKLFRGRIDKAE